MTLQQTADEQPETDVSEETPLADTPDETTPNDVTRDEVAPGNEQSDPDETQEPTTPATQPAAEQQENTGPPPEEPDFRIIVTIQGDSALAGLQAKGNDPHIETIDTADPATLIALLPEILERAQDRWNRNPQNRSHSKSPAKKKKPTPPATAAPPPSAATAPQAPRPRARPVQTEPDSQTALKLF